MPKGVALGQRHHILGFKGVGFEIHAVEDSAGLERELERLIRDPDVALVLVTEDMAVEASAAVENFRARAGAILTVIPTHEGSRHVSFQEIRKSVERSLGVDILGKE
jgi:V/A-type H+/Na+-transporting ATPase subunit F